MSTAEAAFLATTISGNTVSESKIRRLCKEGKILSNFSQGRYSVDEDSVREYFG